MKGVFVKKKLSMSLAALGVVAAGILLVNIFNGTSQAATPRDCDNNAIIKCGATTAGELKEKYNQNATGDLKTVFSHYGISSDMIAAGAPIGQVYKDGRVVLNGKTIATNAHSIGRQKIAGSSAISIGGKQYFQSPNSTAFRSDSISAFIFTDKNGKFIAAILTSCANPVSATPVPPKKPQPQPAYKCVSLTANKISRDTYDFKAVATASGGAEIVKYHYDFGDGHSKSDVADTVSHQYERPGSYVAKLVVDVKVNGTIKQTTAKSCEVPVEVKAQAAYACETLTPRLINKEDRSYAFDLKYTATNGASLQTVDFDFGDGQSREGVKPEELGNVTHNFPEKGDFTIVATLHFITGDNGDEVKDDNCEASISISPEVTPPPVPELPQTGPMDIVGAGVGLGSLIAAGYYWYASRRGLLEAWLSR